MSHIVEHQSIAFVVKFRGIRGIFRTPRHAIAVNQLAESRFVGGLLLCAGARKRQQASKKREHNIKHPVMVASNRPNLWDNSSRHRSLSNLSFPCEARFLSPG